MKRTLLFFLLASFWFIAQGQGKKKLYVFVGEKISLEFFNASSKKEISPGVFRTTVSLDNAYRAKYKVLRNVYGDYQGDTIEFEVYDHYGSPAFAGYENVLLFVSEQEGKLYHVKYQYFDVYRTRNESWASPGDPFGAEPNVYKRNTAFKQVKFKRPVKIELLNGRMKNITTLEQLNYMFREPYYTVKDNIAVARSGTDVKDLLQVKKEGVLKAEGFF